MRVVIRYYNYTICLRILGAGMSVVIIIYRTSAAVSSEDEADRGNSVLVHLHVSERLDRDISIHLNSLAEIVNLRVRWTTENDVILLLNGRESLTFSATSVIVIVMVFSSFIVEFLEASLARTRKITDFQELCVTREVSHEDDLETCKVSLNLRLNCVDHKQNSQQLLHAVTADDLTEAGTFYQGRETVISWLNALLLLLEIKLEKLLLRNRLTADSSDRNKREVKFHPDSGSLDWIKNDLRLITSSFFQQYRYSSKGGNPSMNPKYMHKHLMTSEIPPKDKSYNHNKTENRKEILKAGEQVRILDWQSSFFEFTFYTPPQQNVFVVAPVTRFLPEMDSIQKGTLFTHEGSRLATLVGLPDTCNVSLIRLAKAGFYFDSSKTTRDARNMDEVVCYSCGVTYANWESGANPETIHRQLSPDCLHLKTLEPVASSTKTIAQAFRANGTGILDAQRVIGDASPSILPVHGVTSAKVTVTSFDPSSTVSRNSERLRLKGGHSDSSMTSSTALSSTSFDGNLEMDCAALLPRNDPYPLDFDQPHLSMENAVYPQFSSTAARLATFHGWSLSNDGFQPQLLVSYGYFYAGYADCVRCFYCGVGLKSWHPEDDTLTEHIRWRPHCGFLLATKGRQVVNNILAGLQKNTQKQANLRGQDFQPAQITGFSSQSGTTSHGTGATSTSTTPTASTGRNTKDTVSTATTPLIRVSADDRNRLSEMGFPEELIASAAKDLETSGSPSVDLAALTERILQLSVGKQHENVIVPTGTATSHTHEVISTDGPEESVVGYSPRHSHIQELQEENKRLKEKKTCKVCKSNTVGMIFLPCGHIVACTQCGAKLRHCSSCGEFVKATANVFLS